MAKGMFIVFEGIEGSGKTVQTKEFCKFLSAQNKDVVMTEQPWEHDLIGKLIREELKDKVDAISSVTLQFLFIANRSNHVEKLIEPDLNSGKAVVADRYWMSTAAYGSTLSGNPKINVSYFANLHKIFPVPDVVFFIDVDPQVAYKRIMERAFQHKLNGARKERFDKLDTLQILREKYKELENSYEGVWVTIDGNKKTEEVTADIIKKYNDLAKA